MKEVDCNCTGVEVTVVVVLVVVAVVVVAALVVARLPLASGVADAFPSASLTLVPPLMISTVK